jgi:ACR3 family arsenite transporter
LLTLVIIFIYQGKVIIDHILDIILIAIPLSIQTYLIFILTYFWAWLWKVDFSIGAPAAYIGASNFFELAVAVAITLFGLESRAAVATVVGVLVEVPVMLSLVWIANATKRHYEKRLK